MNREPNKLFYSTMPWRKLIRRLLFVLPAYATLLLFCAVVAAGWGWKEAEKLWEENT